MKIPPVEADLFHTDTERERQRDGHRRAEDNIFLLNLRTHRNFITPQNKQRFFPDTVINYLFL
jgi:hypothetical protein